MRPSQAFDALRFLRPTLRPTLLWGPPGVGKSSVVRQLAAQAEDQFIDIRGSQMDPVDLRGVPFVQQGVTLWATPAFFPKGGEGILFLDEIDKCPAAVQTALLQLCLDRRVGEYQLPDGWWVVAAANRTEDKAGSQRLISPLLNRFVHIDVDVSPSDWLNWASDREVEPTVRGFINFKPDMLHSFDPRSNERAFPTPRSWEFASQIIRGRAPEHLLHDLLAGTVGSGAAAEYMAFRNYYLSLPDLNKWFKDENAYKVPEEPSVAYALATALAEKVKEQPDRLGPATAIAVKLQPEFSVKAMWEIRRADARTFDPSQNPCNKLKKWLLDNHDAIQSATQK